MLSLISWARRRTTVNDSLSEKLWHESSSNSCKGRVSYTSSELLNLFPIAVNEQWRLHNHEAWNTICHLNIPHNSNARARRRRSHRGRRGGRRKQCRIPVVCSQAPSTVTRTICHDARTVCHKNLVAIPRAINSILTYNKICLWNARSIRKKVLLQDYIYNMILTLWS